MGPTLKRRKMRCTIIAVSLAILYASASPITDEIVPEESLYALDDDLAEAHQTVNDMTAAGKSDKDCRKLVEETRKQVQTNVDSCQKIMDSLPKGDSCPDKAKTASRKPPRPRPTSILRTPSPKSPKPAARRSSSAPGHSAP